MKYVGVRDFRDHATRYLSGSEVLAVERHGRPIGFYVPVRQASDEERQRAVAQLGRAVERLLTESGMTEDELAGLLDLNQTGPIEPRLPSTNAPGR